MAVCMLLYLSLALCVGFGSATVSIDGNDVVTVYMLENSAIGTVLVDFHATDSNGGSITWSLNDAQFAISSPGVVTVASSTIDREAIPSPHVISVTVTATSGSESASVTLSVVVQDINDNAPVFENTDTNSDSVTLDEDHMVNSIIYTMVASDPDYGNGGNYHFVDNNPGSFFIVDYFTGDIELIQSLDYETNTVHTITVRIQDDGVPQFTTTVVITVNVLDTMETGPVAVQKLYYSSIAEGSYSSISPPTIATVVGIAGDTDAGILKYTIIDNDQDWIDQFSIVTATGVVTVSGVLDRELQSKYVLGVKITEFLPDGVTMINGPTVTSTIVLIVTDINDNAPQFYAGTYTGFVDENADAGHVVISSVNAFDADTGSNSVFEYRISDKQASDPFQIHPLTGVINVTGNLDYETGPIMYIYTILAVETEVTPSLTGSAVITIYVHDLNDNGPMLSTSELNYIIEENAIVSFTPTVMASDGDTSAKFKMLTFEINGIGTESPYDHFSITEISTNVIQLSNKVKLDKESIDFYHMILTVRDSGPNTFSSTADIYVSVTDLNDFPPEFFQSSYSVTIDEEQTYTTCVTVSATDTGDADSANTGIAYSLSVTSASTNTSLTGLQDRFIIDSVTGVISCEPINHEFNYDTIVLTVTATDSGTNPGPLTDVATVTITVQNLNEHPPVFNQGSYTATIAETHSVGDAIGVTVLATDSGSDDNNAHVITYSIVEGNTNGAFTIGESDGVMTLASQLGINYEELTPNPITVKVEALDTADSEGTEYSATVTVTVTVTDVNEFAPEITAPLGNPVYIVSEGETSLPKTIVTMEAIENDGSSSTIVYSIVAPAYGTFEIGSSTGILVMTKPPDREAITAADDRFTITLIATDTGTPALSTTTTITIETSDENDNDPVFDTNTYTVSPIPENTGGAVSLVTIHAEDNLDIGNNAEVTYTIQSISPIKAGPVKFQLDSSTGMLQTGPAGFDYEDTTDRMYTIVMVAQDGGTPAKTATATTTVTITNINDNPPILCEHSLTYTMNEYAGSTQSASDVIILSDLNCVTDLDNTVFQYRIKDTSNTNDWFNVDNNGNIYIPTGTNIDREHADTIVDKSGRAIFNFEIEVTDTSFSNTGYFSDEAEVTIYITDINDNNPVFSETSIDRTLPEGVPVGTIIDIVTATDNDFNNVITYAETSGDADDLFTVSSDGRISTKKPIDKEMILSAVTFVITATDNGGNTDTINVQVTITDTNDNNPVFNPTFYQENIAENSDSGTFVVLVAATDADPDVNGAISFEIIGGNVDDAFVLPDSTKGEIRVAGSLDRETLSFYRLVVVARDGATGSFQRTAVTEVAITIIDENDNAPMFLHQLHKASVAEDIANNTFVPVAPSIYATDADAGDKAIFTYDIESGFPFTINKSTGFVYTSFVSVLDRETTDFYEIIVYARDIGGMEDSGTLQISVTDINDHSPIIDQTSADLDATISEYYSANGLIGTVTATDQDIGVNSILVYSLTGGEGYFQVDPNSGVVTLSQTIQNLERRTPFAVTITVTDGGLPANQDKVSFQIQVTDENDNAPIFKHSSLVYSYPEDTDVSSPIQLAIDPALTADGVVEDYDDGVNGEYQFVLGSSSSPEFDLNSDTGSLFFTTAMDYETQITYTGSIYIVDKGSPSLTSDNVITITLTVTDINDLPPVLDVDLFTTDVSEYTTANVPLLLVTATDSDTLDENKVITFTLTGSSPAHGLDLFKIDADTGLILTKAFLEDDDKGCYSLDLEARNPGTNLLDTGVAKICVTDQNESPDFDQSFYNFSINENEPADSELGFITASDPDSDPNFNSLTYTLVTTTEDNGKFAINEITGRLATLVPLDRETSDLHILSVIVQDDGNDNFQHTNYTTILVNVLDLNDNSPQLVHSTFNSIYVISENITRNTSIANVTATDVDLATINLFRIVNDEKILFKINHQTGELQTEGGPGDFDRETFLNYTITFEVYNSDDPTKFDQASITFILTDVNDNAPYFTSIPSDTCIFENSPNGMDLGTFTAGDIDLDVNARVFFQIIDGNTAQAFTIEALTGKLKTQNPLDYEEDLLEYTLTIEVQDLGIPPLSATSEITICIKDTNDNPPEFINTITEPIVIEEHSNQGLYIATFWVKDIDSTPFNSSLLSLISGNDNDAFFFMESDNSVYVNDPSVLDYEGGILSYTLTIKVIDVDDPTKTATTSITVLITDINDHPPYFDKTLFNLTILENEALNTILGQVDASDVDTDILTYELISGNDDGKFSLNSSTGVLSLVQTLDYEEMPNYYFLTITVTDGDFFDSAFFHIYIDNINDVHPVITNPSVQPQIITLPEDSQLGLLIYTMKAYDVEGGDLTYSFANGELTTSVVTINDTTGTIILSSGLDYESDIFYEFVVVVMDNGVPSLQDSAHFQIIVTDVNDHLPEFAISSQIRELYENHTIGIEASFLTVFGEDIDVTDTAAGNFYYFVVSEDGYLIDTECGDIFCVDSETGKVYHNRLLDYETFTVHTVELAISNFITPITNTSVTDLGLDTIQIEIRILDNNDNAPQFLTFSRLIGVADDTRFQSIVYTCKTDDEDSLNNYDKVWYRFLTYGIPFTLDTESCIIRTVGEFEDKKGQIYEILIEAYDNEGNNPSQSTDETLKVYIYNNEDNSVITTFNDTVPADIENNIETITNQLSNSTNNTVIITDIRYTILPGGEIDAGSVDVIFIVIGDEDKVKNNQDVLNDLGQNVTIFIDNPNITVVSAPVKIPDPIVRNNAGDSIPLWVIIVIIVILGAIICTLCCALCAFLIVEKRRKRKYKEDKLYVSSDFSAISSKEYTSTKNPLFTSPIIMQPQLSMDSVSIDESIVKPNPFYEEQEINIDLFDGISQDTFSVTSKDELLPPPPLSTTKKQEKNLTSAVIKPFSESSPLSFSSTEDEDDEEPFQQPKPKVPIVPSMEGDELTVDYMNQPDDEDLSSDPSSNDLLQKAVKHFAENAEETNVEESFRQPIKKKFRLFKKKETSISKKEVAHIPKPKFPTVSKPKPKRPTVSKPATDGQEITVDYMNQFDDEDLSSDPSSNDLLQKAVKHFAENAEETNVEESFQQPKKSGLFKEKETSISKKEVAHIPKPKGPIVPKLSTDGQEITVDFMEEFDDEDPPSSDASLTDLLEKVAKDFADESEDDMTELI